MKQSAYALIGYPLGHSISPAIHKHLFELSGKQGDYSLLEFPPEDLEARLPALRKLDGFNVTIPYKQKIIPFLDEIDMKAKNFGAVNTVKNIDGRLIGYNTDAAGFLHALSDARIPLSGHVLLCGTGGVAHMMAHEVISHDCTLTIGGRTYGKAADFADELAAGSPSAKIEPTTLAYVTGTFDLIINGTPVGMFPHVKEMPVPLTVARSAHAVFDAVYNPLETALLRAARKAGASVQNGLHMLVWQAAEAQKLWTGAAFRPEDVAALCKEMQTELREQTEKA